jgi:lipid-binding SYLF domain-containing protein
MKSVYVLLRHRGKMRILLFSLLLVLMMFSSSLSIAAQADDYSKTIQLFKKEGTVQPFFKNAYGYAVFPTIGKGGLGIGGSYGNGKVYQRGKVTGTASLLELSLGLQAGGEAFSEVIFFENKAAYDDFTSGSFEFDAEASGIAIVAGAQAKAGSQGATAGASAGQAGAQAVAKYRKGMAVFVHQKGGLMYEVSIGGQKFSFTPNKKK